MIGRRSRNWSQVKTLMVGGVDQIGMFRPAQRARQSATKRCGIDHGHDGISATDVGEGRFGQGWSALRGRFV